LFISAIGVQIVHPVRAIRSSFVLAEMDQKFPVYELGAIDVIGFPFWRDLPIDCRGNFFFEANFRDIQSKAQEHGALRLNQDVSRREARQDPIAEATESTSGKYSCSLTRKFLY
jgi:hypothetical protein